MKCTRCSTENDEGNAYCHACGYPIDPKVAAIEASLSLRLRDAINAAMRALYQDSIEFFSKRYAEGLGDIS
jgi:hypothetical protein